MSFRIDQDFGQYVPGTGILADVNIPSDEIWDKQSAIAELDAVKGHHVKSTTMADMVKKTTEAVAVENAAQISSNGALRGLDITGGNKWSGKDTLFTVGLLALAGVIVWLVWFKK